LLLPFWVAAALMLSATAVGAWGLWNFQHDVVVWVMLLEALVYAAMAAALWRRERHMEPALERRALYLILGVAAVMRLSLLFAPPVSTDVYRYVWDGRVTAAHINPYRYRPADAQVAFLRDPAVFPNINRADTATTIYPPMAQVIFFAATRIACSVTVMKGVMVGFEIVIVAVLLTLLRRRGLPATRILFYAWHPLPLFEFSGSGHIDAAAIALMLAAALLAERRHRVLAGAVLGAAALVKFFPAVIAPALWERRDWRFLVAMLAAAAALYLPFLGVGWQVLGFLPGYVHEEGLASGGGFFLLGAIGSVTTLPRWAVPAYLLAGGGLLAAIAAAIIARRATALPLRAALLLLGVFTVWVSPHLAWYFTWVIPFLCFSRSWALIYLCGAAPLLYAIVWAPDLLVLQTTLYLPFLIILAIETYFGRGPSQETFNDRRFGPRHAG
jgi:hypothetical protein